MHHNSQRDNLYDKGPHRTFIFIYRGIYENNNLRLWCSGKSTFANHLSNKINIEAIHLDQIFFKENWVEQDKEIFKASIHKGLTKENFIIEGNYSRFGVNIVDLSVYIE